MIRAGRLRHRVTIQQLGGSPDQTASGADARTWGTYLTVWASIEPLSGRELFAAQEHHSDVTHRIRMRYRDGLTAAMRVSFESVVYDIVAVLDPEMRHRELVLMCKTGANQG